MVCCWEKITWAGGVKEGKMKTNFDKLMRKLEMSEKKTHTKKLIRWSKNEIINYEIAKTKPEKKKLIEIIILAMQIALRDNISLGRDLVLWRKKSENI